MQATQSQRGPCLEPALQRPDPWEAVPPGLSSGQGKSPGSPGGISGCVLPPVSQNSSQQSKRTLASNTHLGRGGKQALLVGSSNGPSAAARGSPLERRLRLSGAGTAVLSVRSALWSASCWIALCLQADNESRSLGW